MPHLLQFLSERLIQQEAEIIIKEKGLFLALIDAIQNNKFEVVEYILETHGQDPDAIATLNIDTALELAAKNGCLSVVELLIKKYGQGPGAIAALKISEALKWAAANGHFPIVELLLEKYGRDHNAITTLKISEALGIAVSNGHLPVVELLLEKYGQNPNAIAALWISGALRIAAGYDDLPMVELLLKKYGQNPNAIAALKIYVTLEWAATYGQPPVIELLLNTCIKSNNKTVLESVANLPVLKELAQKANTPPALKQLIDKIPETIKRIELDEVMNPAVQKMQARTNKLSILQARAGENKTNIKALAQQLQELGESVLSPFKLGGE